VEPQLLRLLAVRRRSLLLAGRPLPGRHHDGPPQVAEVDRRRRHLRHPRRRRRRPRGPRRYPRHRRVRRAAAPPSAAGPSPCPRPRLRNTVSCWCGPRARGRWRSARRQERPPPTLSLGTVLAALGGGLFLSSKDYPEWEKAKAKAAKTAAEPATAVAPKPPQE